VQVAVAAAPSRCAELQQGSLQVGHMLRYLANLPSGSSMEAASTNIARPAADISEVRPPPGLPPPVGVPSHGSLLHGTGKCKPCVWFWKAAGCSNGLGCGHCHLCPESEIAARRKRRRAKLQDSAQKCQSSPCDSECETAAGSVQDSSSSQSSGGSRQSSCSPRPGLLSEPRRVHLR